MSCDLVQVIFLSVHVIVTYEKIMFVQCGNFDRGSRFFKFIIILGVKLVLTNMIFKLFVKCIIRPFRTCCILGWSGGMMVLGKLPVPGRPTNLC